MSAKILENDIHVFVVSWRTQEVLAYKDLKTGEIAVGDENKILQVGYVAVLTRVEEELDNPETGGWKVIDVRRALSSLSLSPASDSRLARAPPDSPACLAHVADGTPRRVGTDPRASPRPSKHKRQHTLPPTTPQKRARHTPPSPSPLSPHPLSSPCITTSRAASPRHTTPHLSLFVIQQ